MATKRLRSRGNYHTRNGIFFDVYQLGGSGARRETEEMTNRCVAEGAIASNVDPNGDFVECVECESEVRWDMQDHPFWGFKSSCPKRRTAVRGDREAEALDAGSVESE